VAVRTLVLRDLNPGWGLFFSDRSPKGLALRRDSRLALALWFPSLQRQWRLWGEARPLPDGLLDEHWPRKPRAAKLSDHVQGLLGQSQPVPEAELRATQDAVSARFASVDDAALPRPDHASGVRLSLFRMECLTLHRDAPHERRRFDRLEAGWRETPLVP
jgi:pyridoxamine 5'-phosphate oxidase